MRKYSALIEREIRANLDGKFQNITLKIKGNFLNFIFLSRIDRAILRNYLFELVWKSTIIMPIFSLWVTCVIGFSFFWHYKPSRDVAYVIETFILFFYSEAPVHEIRSMYISFMTYFLLIIFYSFIEEISWLELIL